MLAFAQQIFDNDLAGSSSTWYSLAQYNPLLGSADALSLQILAGNVTGTSPTLTLRFQFSANNQHWVNAAGTAELNAQALTSGGNYALSKNGQSNGVLLRYVRLAISLGGTNPTCRLKLFASGRTL
jgi:hypothetical protein